MTADRFTDVEVTTVTSDLLFPEGPIALEDGSVLVVEIGRGTLTRVLPDGRHEIVADCGGGPNGAAIGPDGAVYVCNNGAYFDYTDHGGISVPEAGSANWTKGTIQRVDLATGAVEVLYESCDGHRLLAPNDIVFDAHGGFWFTDHGVRTADEELPALIYAAADGSSIRPVVRGLDAANGVGLSPAGDRVHVAETYSGRLLTWELGGPGEIVSEATVTHDLGGSGLFDSLAVDADGAVCVGTLGLEGGITVVGGDGVAFLATGDPLTTNICFGRPDHRTAYLTLSGTGRLASCRWPVAGLPTAYGA